MSIILIDNKDSFTYNIAQYVATVSGSEPIVLDNSIAWRELVKIPFSGIIISPGPGRPDKKKDIGVTRDVLEKSSVPVLGVCLGHQSIVSSSGGTVDHADEAYHGRNSTVHHNGNALFTDIPTSFSVTRYHSLVAREPLPSCIEKTCWTSEGMVMGIAHKVKKHWGVQFHPESICSEHGDTLIRNFLRYCPESQFDFEERSMTS